MKHIPQSPIANGATTVLIIGGKGQMGKVFHRIFLEVDCEVKIIDKEDGLFEESEERLSKIKEMVESAHIVLISVPINLTLETIERVAKWVKPESLLMDVTSLKKPFVEKMESICSGEVLGTHPLFGPLEIIKGQRIAMMANQKKIWYPYIKSVFQAIGLVVVETSEKIHDQTMGVVQSLIHFISIALGATVHQQKNELGDSLEDLTTHYYLLHKNLFGRLFEQDPALYADIAFYNENIIDILECFQSQFQVLIDYLKSNDRSGFIEYFKECSKKEPDKEKAYYLIERIMEYLAELEPAAPKKIKS